MTMPAKTEAGIPVGWLPKLDPEWIKLWTEHGTTKQRADEVTVADYRRDPAAYSFTYPMYPGPNVGDIQDIAIPVHDPEGEILVRMYSPLGQPNNDRSKPLPLHFNMHGGGWVLGGLGSEQAWCKHVCNNVGIKVVDIDYRLSPEVRFPVAIYDCWTAIKTMIKDATKYNIDPSSVSIGGLSAGGHMAAVLSHLAVAEQVSLKLQLMIVPSVDLRWEIGPEPLKSEVAELYPSVTLYADSPWGPRGRMSWFIDHWIGTDPEERAKIINDPVASPILNKSFASLCPAHIVTAEFDLSRDESEKYGEMLRASGVPVTMKRYAGMPHAFGHYNHPERGLSQSREYILDTSEVIRKAHGL
ncbi:alpha/beta hydrolase fold-domain-containing protein [Microdochium bolleyi]|uniref:Alpha/beta hydrolase fold-domain-containing protein n=1 Tax=Microdochium bolleyi TaxID=196109 RepID=A0A136ISJ8_9PEZI|nr:alpha/beta hydrolase fold-domain-containing protein [Microdochium bolleyi]